MAFATPRNGSRHIAFGKAIILICVISMFSVAASDVLSQMAPDGATRDRTPVHGLQTGNGKGSASNPSGSPTVAPAGASEKWDKATVITLSLSLLGFALVVLGMMSYLIYNDKPAQPILRTFGTLLIIVAAVFLVIVGYGESQIAPVMGLLGTVAGYLLGKNDSPLLSKKSNGETLSSEASAEQQDST